MYGEDWDPFEDMELTESNLEQEYLVVYPEDILNEEFDEDGWFE